MRTYLSYPDNENETTFPATANVFFSLLLFLSAYSFSPQITLLRKEQTSAGISITYATINLFAATDQLVRSLEGYVIYFGLRRDEVAHNSLTLNDVLNVLQVLVVWLGHGCM